MCVCVYIYSVGAVCVCVNGLCVYHCYLCGQFCIYAYVMCTCALCVSAYWEYIFHLAAGWTWGHGAAVASFLSGCPI